MRAYGSLMDALTDLKSRGYSFDFKKEFSSLYCQELNLWIEPEKFNVDEYYRFEEDSDPDENSIVYAISSIDGVRGVLVDAYGVYAESVSFDMARSLTFKPNHTDEFESVPARVSVDQSSALKTILVPFDFSTVAHHALALAIDIALTTGIQLHVLHVVELPVAQKNPFVSIQTLEDSYKEEMKSDRRNRIALAIKNITNKPIHVSVRISFGTAVHEIIGYAEMSEVDLIIAGSHGALGIREFAIGSNAEKIVRKSTTPVLIIKEYHHQEIRSLVLALDLDANPPVHLLEMTKSFQGLFGAVLHIIHIETNAHAANKPTDQQLQEIQDWFGVENVTWTFLKPLSIEESIIEFAASVYADMICISTHKRGGFSLLNGSIAKHLVNHSARMILTGAQS
jgi:nucleotide-binding universal stress UspA family protein